MLGLSWDSNIEENCAASGSEVKTAYEILRGDWSSDVCSSDLLPGHPDADKDGYVAYPRMNPAEDMVDLLGSSRGYQANVSAISAVKDMIQKSLDLLR